MKKIYFLLVLTFQSVGYLYAQNSTGISFTSPPAPRQTKLDVRAGNLSNSARVNQAQSNLKFINGSFELNTGVCIINGSNAIINQSVVGVTAYGCANEIDLMKYDCSYGTPKAGKYFLALSNHDGTCVDECTMELNKKLVKGQTYTICYFDRGYNVGSCCPPGAPLEIGVSINPDAHGKVVYTSPAPTENAWTHRSFTFVAPNSGKYVSFKTFGGQWTHIDVLRILEGEVNAVTAAVYASSDAAIADEKISATRLSTQLLSNPARNTATLKLTNATGSVQVWLTDMQGKTVWQSSKSLQNIITVDLSHLSNGIFMVVIKDEKERKVLKLIKQ